MDDAPEDGLDTTEDETSADAPERWRLFLRRRRQDGAARLFDLSQGIDARKPPVSKGAIADEDVATLAGVLAESAEAHLLALEEGHKRIDRLSAALQPAEQWSESRQHLKSVVAEWEAGLTAAREGWMRAADEIPHHVAQATAQVLRSYLEETRAALRWLIALGVLLAILWSFSAFWSWRAYASFTAAQVSPVGSARPDGEIAAAADKRTSDSRRTRR